MATMRSNPVTASRRLTLGVVQQMATSPPASRIRRTPPTRAPRPAESTKATERMFYDNGGNAQRLVERLPQLAGGEGIKITPTQMRPGSWSTSILTPKVL